MTTRKLLHVFSSFGLGGIQVRFTQLANHFGKTYHHIILSLNSDLSAAELLDSDLKTDFLVPPCSSSLRRRLRQAAHTINNTQPDLLLTYNWGSILYACANSFMTKRRHVHCEDGFGADESTHQLWRRVWFRRVALRGAQKLIVPSRTLAELAIKNWAIPQSKVQYLPNGIDIVRFHEAAKAELSAEDQTIFDGSPAIITVAALRPEKNLSRLLRAFQQAREKCPAHLVLVGSGPEETILRRLSATLNLEKDIYFIGSRSNPAPLLARAKVFALSSDTEQMPLTVLEAMAAGLPITSVNVGDVATMVSPPNRPYIAPTKDDRVLGEKLACLLANPEQAHEIGQTNRRWVEATYSYAKMSQNWDRIFAGQLQELVQSKN